MSKVTIVMYHYVRPLSRSRYPGIKGLDVDLFDSQLDFLSRSYTFIDVEQVQASLAGQATLPPHPVLLTFDDGYADHYTQVFPRLARRGIRGAFFPPAIAVEERQVLDVNKIHFILASTADPKALIDFIEHAVVADCDRYGLQSCEAYRADYRQAGRFDTAEVIYVKRMLQHALPEEMRGRLTDDLFRRFVTGDEAAFAEELYLTPEQLRHMVQSGQHVGSHGGAHYWLDKLSAKEQREDLLRSISFLDSLGVQASLRTVCYPYGAYNQDTLTLVDELGFRFGFTTRTDVASLTMAERFALPRFDTNDFPKEAL